MDLGQLTGSTQTAVSFFGQISPVIYLVLAVVLVPFIIDILIGIFRYRNVPISKHNISLEETLYGHELSKKQRKEVNAYLELSRYNETLKRIYKNSDDDKETKRYYKVLKIIKNRK